MRVDHSDSATIEDICIDHILKESRLSHTCLSDNIDVTCSIYGFESKSFELPSIVCHPYRSIWAFCRREIMWWLELTGRHPVNSWGFHIEGRKMYDPCKFRDREDHSRLRKTSRKRKSVDKVGFFHHEVIATRISKNIHTSCEFLQYEIIRDGIVSIFYYSYLHPISISFELCFYFFFAFSFFIWGRLFSTLSFWYKERYKLQRKRNR